MNRWDKTCYSFKKVRDMISENIETTSHCMEIMYAMESCCDELVPDHEKDWEFYDDFRDLKAEIHYEVEMMDEDNYEECETIVNMWLNELYNLCDSARVWLGV